MAHNQPLQLPPSLVTPGDLTRVRRELEIVDEQLRQAMLRDPNGQLALPALSQALHELAALNQQALLDETVRKQLLAALEYVRSHAPVVRISFATDPSAAFMGKVVGWFRQNIHPQVIVRIGLQPNLAAGCIVRTADREYDMSLRQHFASQKNLLVEKLRSLPTA